MTIHCVESWFSVWGLLFAVFLFFSLQISHAFDEAFFPPKFPDIISSFSESLSASDSLQLFVRGLVEDNESCGCSEFSKINWTEFNASLGLYVFPDASRCASEVDKNSHEPNVAAVSGDKANRNRPLVIGLSITAVIVVLVLIVVFLTLKKARCIRMAWDVVKGKSVNLEKQRSDCLPTLPSKRHQTVVSVSDNLTCSDSTLVSKARCFNFSGKVKTILLPMKNRNSSKPEDDVYGYCADHTETTIDFVLANGSAAHSDILNNGNSVSTSNIVGQPQSLVNEEVKVPVSGKEKIESSGGKTTSDFSTHHRVNRPILDSSISAESAAWNALPNGRQFINDREDLVDHNNVHLFSYSPQSNELKSSKQ